VNPVFALARTTIGTQTKNALEIPRNRPFLPRKTAKNRLN
jgi:hypothetical protein